MRRGSEAAPSQTQAGGTFTKRSKPCGEQVTLGPVGGELGGQGDGKVVPGGDQYEWLEGINLGADQQGVWACEFQSTVSMPRPVRGVVGKVGGENSLRVPGRQGVWWAGGGTCSDPPRGLCTGCWAVASACVLFPTPLLTHSILHILRV